MQSARGTLAPPAARIATIGLAKSAAVDHAEDILTIWST
jgi:hypothetical protein